jgi:hypothetical protein
MRVTAAEHLTTGVLTSACTWLADATNEADTAWAISEHEWAAVLRDGVLAFEES